MLHNFGKISLNYLNFKHFINNDSYLFVQINLKNGDPEIFVIEKSVKFVKKVKVKFKKCNKILSGIKRKCQFHSCTFYAHILCAYLGGIEFTFKEIAPKTKQFDESINEFIGFNIQMHCPKHNINENVNFILFLYYFYREININNNIFAKMLLILKIF